MRLRIISGEFKGRFISVPQSDLIRPTTDRVRETLFNILNNKVDFKDIEVLDLYSGSGSLGLECLSRGAHHTDFVEKNFQIRKKLEENILSLNLKEKTTVYQEKALTFCDNFRGKKYDLILADPPFFKDDIYEVVKNLLKNNFLAENGFIIIERSIQTKEKDVSNFKVEPFKVIGDACLYEITNN